MTHNRCMTIYILSGKHKGRKIATPQRIETRPATSLLRKMVFDSCQFKIPNARVLDPFAGSGAMGLEAISRGASFVTFNDLSGECIETIKKNLTSIKENGEVFQMDAFALLENLNPEKPYDVVLLHPPYPIGSEGYEHLIEIIYKREDILFSDDASIYLEIPGKLEKHLTPILEERFHIKKCKSRSTWALYHLLGKACVNS